MILLYFIGNPITGGLSRGQIAGIVIGVALGLCISLYVLSQFEKLKKAKQAAANQARVRQPLVPQSQPNETESDVVVVAGPEPTISELSILDTEAPLASEPGPSFPVPVPSAPSFPELIEPSAPTLCKTPPPSFEEASRYPTKSLELDPPPPYPGYSVFDTQPYPINNPAYQS